MASDIHRAVRAVCLWLPEAEEFVSHGSPNYRVRGKTFATFVVNHHGDGRVALWLTAPPGAQESAVASSPGDFFVPAYVGPRGWLGVNLNTGLSWKQIAGLVREAYAQVAPASLIAALGSTPPIEAPRRMPTAGEIDKLQSARGKAVLKIMRTVCLRLPESHETTQFGSPVWQAGKKTFAWARCDDDGFTVCFWVGAERQQLLTLDARYRIPAYLGHNGWIALDVTAGCDIGELEALALDSYRHFALKRMLQALEAPAML